jgi:DNA adenine methylase
VPPLPWPGGKRHLAARLVERIAAIPHDLYAEPFIGMGGVFLRRRLRPRVEVINDLSRDVAGFFRVLQRHPEALYGELAYALASRAEFERLQRVDPSTMTDLERAARFYVLQKLAYAGKVTGRSFGVSGESRFDIGRQRRVLESVHRRLAAVVVECLPWHEFVERYDRPGALFYLDPPYWGGEEDYGKAMFGRADFRRMAEQLRGIKGRFLLSLNDVPAIREIFAGLAIEEVTTTYTISRSDEDRAADQRELIIGDGKGGEVGQMKLW